MTRTIDGRFRLTGFVATGGIGEVWQAVDDGANRLVAVKLLHPPLAADPRLADRLLRSRRALSGLWHPAIARLIDVVVTDETVALVADFVSGTDLARLLAQRLPRSGPLPPARAAEIAATIADGLAAAHRAEIVHGDLKPSNVLIPPGDGEPVKLTDFSVATLVRIGRPFGQWDGAPSYAAPELRAGAPPTPSSDVHALGIVLYEMVTGTPLRDEHADAGIDARLRQVIEWCVAGDQAVRPSTEQVSQRLRELVPQLTGSVPAVRRGPLRPQAPRSGRARGLRRHPVALGVSGAALVAAVVTTVATMNALSTPGAVDAPPTLGSTTTAATSAALPTLPATADTRTPEGGSEFVRYWFEAFTYAVRTGEVAAMAEATNPDCRGCQRAIETIESSYADGGTLRGGGYVVRSVTTTDFWSEDRPVYDATLDRSPRTALDQPGAQRDSLPALSFANCVVVLEWADDRWQVREVVTPGCVD